ncbi:MAG TPA: glycosyltransferase family 4 protein [Ktedonosporobacter sp.]|nr:glycosyltransferase family 4 protein [Ktedonosporobacter sp.]
MSKPPVEGDLLHVFILAFLFRPAIGGAEMQAEKHARQLLKLGHKVTVLTLQFHKSWPADELLDGLHVLRIGGSFRRDGQLRIGRFGIILINFVLLLKLWRLRHQFDLIHSMQFSTMSATATFICKLMHKPIVISIQSAGPDEKQALRHAQQGVSLMADTLQGADYLTVNARNWVAGDLASIQKSIIIGGKQLSAFLKSSHAYYQALSTRSRSYLISNGFRPEQIVIIPNGVDTEKYQPATRPDPAKPERDIICVARLEYPKGTDVLLHAWGRLMNAPAGWRAELKPRLRIAGGGEFRPQMERIVRELGIQDSVEFLGMRRDVLDLLHQAWGFVLPSRWEGMPNALVEAMACGLPCVATCVSGSEDLITHGVNGLLVPPEDPAEMAQALRRIIEDTALAEQLACEARATIVRDYQISSVVERCLNLYRQLRSGGKPAIPHMLEQEVNL